MTRLRWRVTGQVQRKIYTLSIGQIGGMNKDAIGF